MVTVAGAAVIGTVSTAAYIRHKGNQIIFLAERGAVNVAALAADVKSLKEDLNSLKNEVSSLKDDVKASKELTSRTAEGSPARQFAMFDDVSLYQKHGIVELYGLSLRPRQAGPIKVRATELHVTEPRAFVVWSPDYSPVRTADRLTFDAGASLPTSVAFRVGIVSADDRVYLFNGGNAAAQAPPAPPTRFPEALVPLLASERGQAMVHETDGTWTAPLPPQLRTALQRASGRGIKHWFLEMTGASGQVVQVLNLSINSLIPSPRDAAAPGVRLTGHIQGATLRPGTPVALMAENGVVVTTELAPNNRFGFVNVPSGTPLSLRVRYNEQDYYAALGRWFVVDSDRDDVFVDLKPRYLNTIGKPVDIKDAKIEVDYGSTLDEVFAVHARQRWTGTGGLQDYDSLTFSNNIGQLDRDRLDDNPDRCIRIAQIGSSHNVSLQVPIFEKTNILMESELSVSLQHCVEVLSLGVNNGDIAANLPFLDAFIRKSNIQFVLFEHGSYLMNNFDPDLYRKAFGFDPAFRHIAYIAAGRDKKLVPVPRSKEAALHSNPADLAPVVPGLPFWDTLRVPMPDLAASAQNAYQHFSNVVDFVRRRFPDVTFVMFTGLDQAQCHRLCTRELRTEAGRLIPYGADVFVRNMRTLCETLMLACVHPEVPPGTNLESKTYLHFASDAHFNTLGHQWLAKALTKGLEGSITRP
jgi:hypothetical protein